jgi:hypothetical protein
LYFYAFFFAKKRDFGRNTCNPVGTLDMENVGEIIGVRWRNEEREFTSFLPMNKMAKK